MVNTEFQDYYLLFSLDFPSTEKEIKLAYRKLARENHPDMHPDNSEDYTEKFKEITEAYETLSHPIKKGIYDLKYRQIVLNEFPQYEDVVDTTPPDTFPYAHKYTRRSSRKIPYYSLIALVILVFQVLRMLSSSAPLEKVANGAHEVESRSNLMPEASNVHQGTIYHPYKSYTEGYSTPVVDKKTDTIP